MTSRDFCFWAQGYFELTAAANGNTVQGLTSAQTHVLKKHLALVFKHEIDPAMGDQAHQDELNEIHNDSLETEIEERPPFVRPTQPGWMGEDGQVMRC